MVVLPTRVCSGYVVAGSVSGSAQQAPVLNRLQVEVANLPSWQWLLQPRYYPSGVDALGFWRLT